MARPRKMPTIPAEVLENMTPEQRYEWSYNDNARFPTILDIPADAVAKVAPKAVAEKVRPNCPFTGILVANGLFLED